MAAGRRCQAVGRVLAADLRPDRGVARRRREPPASGSVRPAGVLGPGHSVCAQRPAPDAARHVGLLHFSAHRLSADGLAFLAADLPHPESARLESPAVPLLVPAGSGFRSSRPGRRAVVRGMLDVGQPRRHGRRRQTVRRLAAGRSRADSPLVRESPFVCPDVVRERTCRPTTEPLPRRPGQCLESSRPAAAVHQRRRLARHSGKPVALHARPADPCLGRRTAEPH